MAEFFFEGDEASYINSDRLSRTLKFAPQSRRRVFVSAGELLNALAANGIQPDEISGVYKVSSNDLSFSVQFKFADTVNQVNDLRQIKVGDTCYEIMKMDEQVNLRVHWMPLYYDGLILTEILESFGEVVDTNLSKTAHADVVAYDGVREVRLRTDELRKHKIPHVVHFNSGQSILITMQGRPPYCLRCKSVGHVRQRCPKNKFSSVVVDISASDPAPTPPPAPVVHVASPAEPHGSAGEVTESHVEDNAAAKGTSGQEQASQDMDLDPEKGLKRAREGQEGASEGETQLHSPGHRPWITPNKVARSVVVPQGTLPLSNSFDPGLGMGDLIIDA